MSVVAEWVNEQQPTELVLLLHISIFIQVLPTCESIGTGQIRQGSRDILRSSLFHLDSTDNMKHDHDTNKLLAPKAIIQKEENDSCKKMGKVESREVNPFSEPLDSWEERRGTWGNPCLKRLHILLNHGQPMWIFSFLSCIRSGFGNVWRIPYLCYNNVRAAFLIPYVIMLLCAGLPMFFMELAVWQYASLGPNILFRKITLLFSGLEWVIVVVSMMVSV